MVINVIVVVVILLFIILDLHEIFIGIRAKRYYQTYRFLRTTAFKMIIQSFYAKIYKEKIFEDAVKVKYHWIAGHEETINLVFADYKKNSLSEQFSILELFEEYKLNDFELTNFKKSKKILRDEKLYLELEKIYHNQKDDNE